jgi:alpha-tubulin suppressor-like RCC1 family protein
LGCGRNIEGQLGIGNNSGQNTLQQVIGATDIKQISAASVHSLFLKKDGTVWGCGYNNYGQLGIGNNNKQNTLQQVKGLNGNGYITDIKQISTGVNYSLFLKNDGTVFSCGDNYYGQLGIGNSIRQNTLQQVQNANNIIQIFAAYDHSLFLKNDGTVWSCGNNYHGQLGTGNNNIQFTLQQVINVNIIN